MTVLGIVLVVVGLLVVLAGVVGGVARMLREERTGPKTQAEGPDVAKFMEALSQLVETLKGAPAWLALVAVGFVVMAFGCVVLVEA